MKSVSPTDHEIRDSVTNAYKAKYSRLDNFSIERIIRDVLGGNFVLVKYITTTEEYEDSNDELCFVDNALSVEIFQSDESLAIALQRQAEMMKREVRQVRLIEIISSKAVISGFVFILVMTALIIAMFFDTKNKDVLAIIGSIAGAAGGFYFGTKNQPEGGG